LSKTGREKSKGRASKGEERAARAGESQSQLVRWTSKKERDEEEMNASVRKGEEAKERER
jgi:hypothetical protein